MLQFFANIPYPWNYNFSISCIPITFSSNIPYPGNILRDYPVSQKPLMGPLYLTSVGLHLHLLHLCSMFLILLCISLCSQVSLLCSNTIIIMLLWRNNALLHDFPRSTVQMTHDNWLLHLISIRHCPRPPPPAPSPPLRSGWVHFFLPLKIK